MKRLFAIFMLSAAMCGMSTVCHAEQEEVYTRPGYDFYAPLGCVVEVEEGSINGPYKKMPSQ